MTKPPSYESENVRKPKAKPITFWRCIKEKIDNKTGQQKRRKNKNHPQVSLRENSKFSFTGNENRLSTKSIFVEVYKKED